MSNPAPIARLKVVLDDVEPMVMRRLAVPLTIRLDRLHITLQAALEWTDSHLYEFRFGEVGFGIPDPDYGIGDGPIEARKTTLRAALADTGRQSFTYIYDFGDNWQHSVKVEKIEPGVPGMAFPMLIAATGRCPPEDVGGAPGYAEFLEAISDPAHEQHDDVRRWIGEPFDPNEVDTSAISEAVDKLARRWTRKKA